jgi:hypothetical protein
MICLARPRTIGEVTKRKGSLQALVFCQTTATMWARRPEGRSRQITNTDETSMIQLTQTWMKIHHSSSIRPIKNKLFSDEIHHASSVQPIKNKLLTYEDLH